MADTFEEQQGIREYQKEGIQVIFRKSTPMSDKKCKYPGFKPSTTTLSKGSIHRKGALPLPCDIIFERDVAVPMRVTVSLFTLTYTARQELKRYRRSSPGALTERKAVIRRSTNCRAGWAYL